MFTGIVEELGTVKKIKKGANSAVFTIQAEKILDDLKTGDSVAVNGICLTVTACLKNGFTADVMHETLNRSALIQLSPGQHVNLDRAMPANGRFGGHIVAGHVDGTGRITKIHRDDNAVWYTIQSSDQIMKYIVIKGSVTIDKDEHPKPDSTFEKLSTLKSLFKKDGLVTAASASGIVDGSLRKTKRPFPDSSLAARARRALLNEGFPGKPYVA